VTVLKPHNLKVALVHPQIAPNTGNIARLCVATGTELHLVRPIGFVLDDKEIRRSAMDYWPRLRLRVHDDLAAFLQHVGDARLWMFSTKGTRSHWDADYRNGDWLFFGSETHGLPSSLLRRDPSLVVRIPQAPDERCLNLSTAAGIGLYAALENVQNTNRR
jgi:tRNA (cytidine/uridine-2'-O-)-methyltransferase